MRYELESADLTRRRDAMPRDVKAAAVQRGPKTEGMSREEIVEREPLAETPHR